MRVTGQNKNTYSVNVIKNTATSVFRDRNNERMEQNFRHATLERVYYLSFNILNRYCYIERGVLKSMLENFRYFETFGK
jgi:hypothetical protein